MSRTKQSSQLSGLRGIVICGGGYRYFTNALINIQLLRLLGCRLPIELWMLEEEKDRQIESFCRKAGVRLRVPERQLKPVKNVPSGSRWQWALKPLAILESSFREVLFLDSDSFPVQDPEYLFDEPAYRQTGALFWPDIGVMEESREIWKMMGVPFRVEPEFETGQMVIDKGRCLEPLKLALQMNLEAEKYYKVIWGDKDTFRFAWHKFGHRFAMPPYELQLLALPGRPFGTAGVMCQHDFEGNRLFQHRNLAKWDLLDHNPRIPGYLFEEESREFLTELRTIWDGRIRRGRSHKRKRSWTTKTAKILVERKWLLEDTRRLARCCGPAVAKVRLRQFSDWLIAPPSEKSDSVMVESDVSTRTIGASGLSPNPLGIAGYWLPFGFHEDGTVSENQRKETRWWQLSGNANNPVLELVGEDGISARLKQISEGNWEGKWLKERGGPKLRLRALANVYPATAGSLAAAPAKTRPIHIANHAFGIGDAITGLYAAIGAARMGHKVTYHTRFPAWMARVKEPALTITDDTPPKGTPDMAVEYPEQLRYGRGKASWYGQFITGKLSGTVAAAPYPAARPTEIDEMVEISRLDFPFYVILAPFAAWSYRDWPTSHWRRLGNLLAQAGYEVVAIGTSKEAEKMEQAFNKSNVYWAIDHPPEWVMDAMLGAAAVIGPDSGMVHVAGLLDVPTLCVHSQLPPDFLFECTRVVSVSPKTACVFCRWQENRRYNDACMDACSALGTVGPEEVRDAFLKLVSERGTARVLSRTKEVALA